MSEEKFENFERIISSEQIISLINNAIVKIKEFCLSNEMLKAIENKINTLDIENEKKVELLNKANNFLKDIFVNNFTIEAFRNQIIASINDIEKLKNITEDEVIKIINDIEKKYSTINELFIDEFIRLLFDLERTKAEEKIYNGKTPAQIEIEKLKALSDEYLNMLQRLKADFDNYKKRVIREREEQKILSLESILRDLISVLDSFESIKPDSKIDYEGIMQIYKLLLSILEKYSLKEIKEFEKFDANIHQAIACEERNDIEDNTILETFRKGYKLGEKILRPALVKVSVKPQNEETTNNSSTTSTENSNLDNNSNNLDSNSNNSNLQS